jgi:glycerophosphoinositol glycerophosphodiesterase
LEEALENDQHMFIDIKAQSNEIVDIILNAYKKYPQLYEKAVISAFNPITVYTVTI